MSPTEHSGQDLSAGLNYEGTHRRKLRDIPRNNWAGLFTNINVMKPRKAEKTSG